MTQADKGERVGWLRVCVRGTTQAGRKETHDCAAVPRQMNNGRARHANGYLRPRAALASGAESRDPVRDRQPGLRWRARYPGCRNARDISGWLGWSGHMHVFGLLSIASSLSRLCLRLISRERLMSQRHITVKPFYRALTRRATFGGCASRARCLNCFGSSHAFSRERLYCILCSEGEQRGRPACPGVAHSRARTEGEYPASR